MVRSDGGPCLRWLPSTLDKSNREREREREKTWLTQPGFNATLNEYFENDLLFDPSVSSFLTNMFIATNYAFSLVGGIVADEFLGEDLELA